MTTRESADAQIAREEKRELRSPMRNVSVPAMLALVPLGQRLEMAAVLLADEVRRLNDPSIAPLAVPDDRRLSVMARVIRATSALRQRFAEYPGSGDVDGVCLRYALTERQEQILKLILFALPEKTIAQRMGLSRHTVHEHVKVIYRKLVVNSRAELMVRCLREEFVDEIGTVSANGPAVTPTTPSVLT